MAQIRFKSPPKEADAAQLTRWLDAFLNELSYILANLDEENHTTAYNERSGK